MHWVQPRREGVTYLVDTNSHQIIFIFIFCSNEQIVKFFWFCRNFCPRFFACKHAGTVLFAFQAKKIRRKLTTNAPMYADVVENCETLRMIGCWCQFIPLSLTSMLSMLCPMVALSVSGIVILSPVLKHWLIIRNANFSKFPLSISMWRSAYCLSVEERIF